MKDLRGKVAVITGGGSGIGRSMATTFADAGMTVVVADIEASAASDVAREVGGMAVTTDVASHSSVQSLAERAFGEFGAIHLLCNNAGVSAGGTADKATPEEWEWCLSVNLDGVVNGLLAFLPRMREQPGEAHIVNTASLAGVIPESTIAYATSKHGVVAISEAARSEAAAHGVGVTVVCPGMVRTRILDSNRNRPDALGGPKADGMGPVGRLVVKVLVNGGFFVTGKSPDKVARQVRAAVENNDPYVFTHRGRIFRHLVDVHATHVLAGFDA